MRTLASPSDLPDQTHRTVVVTGGSSGIGRAAASAFAAKGARVVLAVRDPDRGWSAAQGLGGEIDVHRLDLASLDSIRNFASRLEGPVDVLINNAGTMTGAREETIDGFELQLGVNHLGHFALANLLLDRITGRVVTVSSTAHRSATIDFDDLHWEKRPYRPFGAYGQSKLANLLFTAELQRRLQAAGSPVLATAAHPGWAATGFRMTSGRRGLDAVLAAGTRLLAHGPEGGSLPVLLAAVGDIPGGTFVGPSRWGGVRGPAAVTQAASRALEGPIARRLWDVSERLTDTHFPLHRHVDAPDR